MEFTERMIVLRVGKFKEADLWVRLLSPSRGVLSAFAFGGSRSRRRFSGCLDQFNEVLFHIKGSRSGGYLNLEEGTLMAGPQRLRRDWPRLGLAINCAKFLEAFGIGREGSEQAWNLFHNLLSVLEQAAAIPELLPLFFRFRLASDQGYALDFSRCSACGLGFDQTPGAFLALSGGYLVCADCASGTNGPMFGLGKESLDALSHILEYTPDAWGGITLPPQSRRECSRAVDAFIQYHVGLAWENGRFVRV